MDPGGNKQREHRPNELGPRLFNRRGWYAADLRPWADASLPAGLVDRPTLRNPKAEGWPFDGTQLAFAPENADTAREWSWAYVTLYRDEIRRAEVGTGRAPLPLGKAVELFLKHRKKQVAHNTWSSARTACGHLVTEFGAGASTATLTQPRLQRLFDDMVDEGYAVTTLETLRNQLSCFFQWLGREDGKPARSITLPKRDEFEVEAWDADQLQRIRAAADKVDFARRGRAPSARFAVELGLGLGLRQQELFAYEGRLLKRADEEASVRRQLVKDGHGFKVLKGRRARTLWVLPSFWDHHDPERRGLLVCNADGTPIGSQSRLQRDLIQRTLDTAGLNAPGVGWHSLRHAYARMCLEDYGVTVDELSMFLGHANPTVTHRVYGHYGPSRAVANVRERNQRQALGRTVLRAG